MNLLKKPFLKPRGFCPNPVPTYGIPDYADSMVNPKVVGTPAWKSWWEEQIYYIINGYVTEGVFIPGRYYYYLNFCKTSSVATGGAFYPDYIDFQYEFFLLVEEAKKQGKNIIAPKGRRKGMSVMSASIVDYGYRFLHNYHAGIAAGKKEYSEDFLEKWIYLNSLMVPELKTRTASKDYNDIVSGWSEKDNTGIWTDMGTRNILYCRTMFSDPNVFKGKYLNDVVYEESGEFDNLIETMRATKKCLMDGDTQVGTGYIYGTGGNIKSGSKGFEEVWHNPEVYNCLRYFVRGTKFLRPYVSGTRNGQGELIEDIPNLMDIPDYQRVGMEDEKRAEEAIEAKKEILLKSKNMKDYWEECKDNPLDIKDVFRRAASNNFDIETLNNQQFDILSNDKKYSKFKLEYKVNENGERLTPLQIEAVPANDDMDENETVMILDGGFPVKGYSNIDVAGIDSYDQDTALESKSLGSMVILRRDHTYQDMPKMTPVLLIRCRPARKEMFYEMCLKAAIFYNVKYNTLIDVAKPMVIEYFKQNGCAMYLAKRPPKFESENSQQTHEYGVSINAYSKPLMISAIQSFVLDYGKNIWFPQMIEELLNYDEIEKDSDNDSVDALGVALMQNISNHNPAFSNTLESGAKDPYAFPEFYEDSNGNVIEKNTGVEEQLVSDADLIKAGIDPWEYKMEQRMLREGMSEENEEYDDLGE